MRSPRSVSASPASGRGRWRGAPRGRARSAARGGRPAPRRRGPAPRPAPPRLPPAAACSMKQHRVVARLQPAIDQRHQQRLVRELAGFDEPVEDRAGFGLGHGVVNMRKFRALRQQRPPIVNPKATKPRIVRSLEMTYAWLTGRSPRTPDPRGQSAQSGVSERMSQDLARIRAFVQVFDAGGFSAAARQHGRSKALLSQVCHRPRGLSRACG